MTDSPAPMSAEEAEAFLDRVETELMPQLRRAMYGVAAVAAAVGVVAALVFLSILAVAK